MCGVDYGFLPLQYEVAAVGLVEMGAVEFLSQLRPHCLPSIHPTIDDILEKLLRIPPSLFPPSPSLGAGGGLQSTEPRQTPLSGRQDGGWREPEREEDGVQVLKLTACEGEENSHTHERRLPLFAAVSTPSFSASLSSPTLVPASTANLPAATSSLARPRPPTPQPLSATSGTGQEGGGEEREKTGEKRLFPWLRLSLNDLHILKTAEKYDSSCV